MLLLTCDSVNNFLPLRLKKTPPIGVEFPVEWVPLNEQLYVAVFWLLAPNHATQNNIHRLHIDKVGVFDVLHSDDVSDGIGSDRSLDNTVFRLVFVLVPRVDFRHDGLSKVIPVLLELKVD